MNDPKCAVLHTCAWAHVLWGHTAVRMCEWVRAHVHGSVFITVYTLRGSSLCSAWFHWADRYTDRQGGRGSFLIISPSFLSLLTVLRSCVTAHAAPAAAPGPASLFTAPEARLLMHLLHCSPPRPELHTPMTAQDAHFVCRVCPKIVSICIFGNGNVCLINLCVRGAQREL